MRPLGIREWVSLLRFGRIAVMWSRRFRESWFLCLYADTSTRLWRTIWWAIVSYPPRLRCLYSTVTCGVFALSWVMAASYWGPLDRGTEAPHLIHAHLMPDMVELGDAAPTRWSLARAFRIPS